MVHIGDTSAIDAMRFGTVGTNHQRTATTKSVIPPYWNKERVRVAEGMKFGKGHSNS